MGEVFSLPQVTFAENKLIEITEIFKLLCNIPFQDLAKMRLTAGDTNLTSYEALNNIGVCFANMAKQLNDWEAGYNPDAKSKYDDDTA